MMFAVLARALQFSVRAVKSNLLRGWLSSSVYSPRGSTVLLLRKMSIQVLPALDDNYMYLLIDEVSNQAAVIDPVEPQKVYDAVKSADVELTAILTTHHHSDHDGGNKSLLRMLPGLKVYGADNRIAALNALVKDGDEFQIGSLSVRCLSTPCHTSGHICYYVTTNDDKDRPVVFTGDTLFVGGCGKFFEGTAADMHHALVDVLSALPHRTEVFCGHEYTVSNLQFAAHVDPHNQALKEKMAWAKDMRREGIQTVPSTIGEELSYNPFMRVGVAAIQKHVGKSDPILTMKALREEKNSFVAK